MAILPGTLDRRGSMVRAPCAQGSTKKDHPGISSEGDDSQGLFLCNKLGTVIIENRVELQSSEYRRQLFFWFREKRSDFKLLFERYRGVRRIFARPSNPVLLSRLRYQGMTFEERWEAKQILNIHFWNCYTQRRPAYRHHRKFLLMKGKLSFGIDS